MRWDFERTPALWSVFRKLGLGDRPRGRQLIVERYDASDVSLREITEAIFELRHPENRALVSPEQILALAASAAAVRDAPELPNVIAELQQLVDEEWDRSGPAFAELAIGYSRNQLDIFNVLPRLLGSAEFLDAICDALEANELEFVNLYFPLDRLALPTRNQLRRLFQLASHKNGPVFIHNAVKAASKNVGWSPWLKLFCVIWLFPELADNRDAIMPVARNFHSDTDATAREEAWKAARLDAKTRSVAAVVIDLNETLRNATPDIRQVYADRLRRSIGNDDSLRQAAIEALLWTVRERQRDTALYAAVQLASPNDRELLSELERHPDRRTQYEAAQLRLAFEDAVDPESGWTIPRRVGISDGLFAMTLSHPEIGESAHTWLGDRLLERMIEQTVAALEAEAAREYYRHHGSGEEKLVERFFTKLSAKFEMLDRGLAEMASASGRGRRTNISIRYRSVDKAEEGSRGVSREKDSGKPPPAFSADLCLIVNAMLDGKSLGKRATLVQVKRLYPSKSGPGGWGVSYRIDPVQTSDLLRQTSSAVFLFQGPSVNGRGLPVIPAQLVDDLAHNQVRSGKALRATTIGVASKPLADWFTYDLVALRIGDPYGALVEKAERGPGSDAYDLFRYGTVEVEVRVSDLPKRLE
ncbi:hypothetical protein K6M90_24055 [Rhizobium sp. 9T]|uniref:hypothetical protein n=1 Tax=Rhizobium croatiense TaxID=2867516 RepID=UPI001C932E19|nr:hypothetical protein [Rhizobium croatiense]MBY4610719.1 hypothetical protein [Rhizobium croatiense]